MAHYTEKIASNRKRLDYEKYHGRGGPSNLIKGGFQADDTESAIDKFLSIPDKTITVKFIVCYLLIGLKKITHQ